MSIGQAFAFIIKMQGELCSVRLVDGTTFADVLIARSNINRKLEGIEDSSFAGREFVLTKEEADKAGWTSISNGDRITTPTLGTNSITEVIPQIVLGSLIGYRVRTG